jgi:streptomycin 6-kinase
MVRALEHEPGAILLERLSPGRPLVTLSLAGSDDEATRILADVIARMNEATRRVPANVPNAERLGLAFDRYLDSPNERIPRALVTAAREEFAALCASQGSQRLLHGDLQHYNVLYDDVRGWTAIDPKGVVAEIEYEIGASLRNPTEAPVLFTSSDVIERRVAICESSLPIDGVRVLRWAFAQAVLSLVWCVEDGVPFDTDHPHFDLARMIEAVLEHRG